MRRAHPLDERSTELAGVEEMAAARCGSPVARRSSGSRGELTCARGRRRGCGAVDVDDGAGAGLTSPESEKNLAAVAGEENLNSGEPEGIGEEWVVAAS